MSMLAMWGYVEADFRRDYGIRLCDELPRMSWREFQTLLAGLSPWGAVASNHERISKQERLRMEHDHPETAEQSASAFWAQVTSMGSA